LARSNCAQPAAFTDGDEVEPGFTAITIMSRLNNKVLQHAVPRDAGGQAFRFPRRMLDLAHVAAIS
jgi:hypothetical protein